LRRLRIAEEHLWSQNQAADNQQPQREVLHLAPKSHTTSCTRTRIRAERFKSQECRRVPNAKLQAPVCINNQTNTLNLCANQVTKGHVQVVEKSPAFSRVKSSVRVARLFFPN
jgi:hypothetical protein